MIHFPSQKHKTLLLCHCLLFPPLRFVLSSPVSSRKAEVRLLSEAMLVLKTVAACFHLINVRYLGDLLFKIVCIISI